MTALEMGRLRVGQRVIWRAWVEASGVVVSVRPLRIKWLDTDTVHEYQHHIRSGTYHPAIYHADQKTGERDAT